MVYVAVHLPSPESWKNQAVFTWFFNNTLFTDLMGIICLIIGTVVNAYLISKWKIILKGKHFWLRSIGSTLVGELIQLFFVFFIGFMHSISFEEQLKLVASVYLIRTVFAFIAAYPGQIISSILKKLEGTEVYDHNLKFNPFAHS